MMVQVVKKPENRTKPVFFFCSGSRTHTTQHDNLDPVRAWMGAKALAKNLLYCSILTLSFHKERKLGLGIKSKAVNDKFKVATRILTNFQFRHMGNDRPSNLIRMRKFLPIQIFMQKSQHV